MGKEIESDEEFEEGQLVPAVYARSQAEAEQYKTLLDDHGVPAVVEEDDDPLVGRPGRKNGIAILVVAELLADATDILADRDNLDEEFRGHYDQYEDSYDDEDEEGDGFNPEEMQLEVLEDDDSESERYFDDDDEELY